MKPPVTTVVQSPGASTVPVSYVLPGRFAADTTTADLEQWFGKANVRIDQLPGAEGETIRGILLYPDDATRRAHLYFQDEDTLRGLQMVRIVDATSIWTMDSGIGIGMALAELVRINGKPIGFFGFDWDYGGHVTDWHGGVLAPRDGELTRRTFRLDLPEKARGDTPYRNLPIGDGEFQSDDSRFAGLKLVVGEMGVSFPGEDDR
ncbi:MAG: hypothetical protein ABIO38_07540 [Luteimonas sp.]